MGATIGSYLALLNASNYICWGFAPTKKKIGSARSVAASRGSTGTRPMEAQHCDNLRCTSARLRPSTGLVPVGAAIGSYLATLNASTYIGWGFAPTKKKLR